MAVIFFRTLIILTALIILMRLMGKRQIGEMQPFEFILTLIIADLACVPMADVSIPLVYGIVSISCLFIIHQLLSILEQSGKIFKRVISGKPSIVINKDGVDVKELKKNNLNVGDLIESMRTAGYFSFDDLSYAIYEANGSLSAFENANTYGQTKSLPLLIIEDGKIDKSNCDLIHTEQQSVMNFLKSHESALKRVEVMTIDGTGRVYLKTKNNKYQILSYPIKEGASW